MKNQFQENRVMLSDSYKYSHPAQYYPSTVSMFDYFASRGGKYPDTVFIGLQLILKKYFSTPITASEVQEAADYAKAHGEPFDFEGWMHIVENHEGYLPVKIRAVKEGKPIPAGNVLMTIESTDDRVYWIVGWLETILMKLWYPTLVATKSYTIRKLLESYAEEYADSKDHVPFQFHNFGDRAATCTEQAAIGGIAHLTQFMGTDNFNALRYAKHFYDSDCAGFSIPASEHSTVTSWGKDKEFDFYNHHLETFKDYPLLACVLDSYNIYKAVDYVTSGEFRQKVESPDYPKFILRPDSGEPEVVVAQMLEILTKNDVLCTVNQKGLKVMQKYGIIYGDGISTHTIKLILDATIKAGYCPSNIAFGSGGWLMQEHSRDTNRFAIKCSSINYIEDNPTNIPIVNIKKRDVFKDPITDKSKASLKGELELVSLDGTIQTIRREDVQLEHYHLLDDVYIDGKLLREQSLNEIRELTM